MAATAGIGIALPSAVLPHVGNRDSAMEEPGPSSRLTWRCRCDAVASNAGWAKEYVSRPITRRPKESYLRSSPTWQPVRRGELAGHNRLELVSTKTTRMAADAMENQVMATEEEAEKEAAIKSDKSGGGEVMATKSIKSKKNPAADEKKAAGWKKLREMLTSGAICPVRVDGINNGGLIVHLWGLQGFIPLSQIDQARLTAEQSSKIADVAAKLAGQTISVKVIEASEVTGRLILSEKAVTWSKQLGELAVGDNVPGVVTSLTDFGAFVDVQLPGGGSPMSGLVHLTELAWDVVRDPADVVEEGQEVKVKVIGIDRDRLRLSLSIKQLESDPLRETLDTLMPLGDSNGAIEKGLGHGSFGDGSSTDGVVEGKPTALPGLQEICDEMRREEGIQKVTLGRQAVEKKVVSQDLELWLSNVPVEGGFTLLARSGRQVQEVNVLTSLDREEMKQAVKRVTTRVP